MRERRRRAVLMMRRKNRKKDLSLKKIDCQENHQISQCLSVNTLGQHNDARAP